ncbi:hypothetical protein [Paraburkholderia sp. 2C]
MDRLIAPNTVDAAHADTAPASGTPGYATDGNPATGVPATLWPSYQYNAIQEELIALIAAGGLTPSKGTLTQVRDAIRALLNQSSPAVGAVRNLKASLIAAGTSIAFTADEVGVKSALGGVATILPSFSETVTTTGSGIGGVVGTALVASKWAGIYAAWGPTVGAGIFCTGGTALFPEVYGGTLPSGYTESALISVWPLDTNAHFAIASQFDRSIGFPSTAALNNGTVTSITALSVASILPLNAKSTSGSITYGNSASSTSGGVFVYENAGSSGTQAISASVAVGNSSYGSTFNRLKITLAQSIYYATVTNGGTPSFAIGINGYEF